MMKASCQGDNGLLNKEPNVNDDEAYNVNFGRSSVISTCKDRNFSEG